MSQITTHILDTSLGQPAAAVTVTLDFKSGEEVWRPLGRDVTNADGRAKSLVPDGATLTAGIYKLSFHVADYFNAAGRDSFYPIVEIQFQINDTKQHYHVPLLLNPFGYGTYRGS